MGTSDTSENGIEKMETSAVAPPEQSEDAEVAAERLDERPEHLEVADDPRLQAASEELKRIDWLKEENWQSLDEFQRRATLREAGRVLGRHFEFPAAPLITKEMPEGRDYIQLGETPPDGYEIDIMSGLSKKTLRPERRCGLIAMSTGTPAKLKKLQRQSGPNAWVPDPAMPNRSQNGTTTWSATVMWTGSKTRMNMLDRAWSVIPGNSQMAS